MKTSSRVVVGIAPTLAGYQALRYAVAEARRRSVPLIAVRLFRDSTNGLGGQWNDVLRESCKLDVTEAFRTALGGVPGDVDVQVAVTVGPPAQILPELADSPDDLLVIGGSVHRWGGGKVAKQCARRAVCPVVIVPVPELARDGSPHRLGRRAVEDAEKFLTSTS
jgi:nucleotide-binding universal stress UspA family protein